MGQEVSKEFQKSMKVKTNSGPLLDLYECPRCGCSMGVNHPKNCPNCQQHVVYTWDAEWNLMNYADYDDLEGEIQKMDVTSAPELVMDVNEHMHIYNWLKELREYRKICSLETLLKRMEGR